MRADPTIRQVHAKCRLADFPDRNTVPKPPEAGAHPPAAPPDDVKPEDFPLDAAAPRVNPPQCQEGCHRGPMGTSSMCTPAWPRRASAANIKLGTEQVHLGKNVTSRALGWLCGVVGDVVELFVGSLCGVGLTGAGSGGYGAVVTSD